MHTLFRRIYVHGNYLLMLSEIKTPRQLGYRDSPIGILKAVSAMYTTVITRDT